MRNITKRFAKRLNTYGQYRWFRIISSPLSIAALVVIILSALGISGSSIGIYSSYFDTSSDSLIAGTPRAIRSDEWLVNSQMLIAQKEANYPYINENIGSGQNMSLVLDVPYREWSILLRPQNLAFFVLPFDMAFAFKWWFVLFILFAGVYLLAKRILGSKKLVATILAAAICLTPFVQWWLSPGIVLILGYSCIILYLLFGIHETSLRRKKLLLSAALSYISVLFAIILYPPFQIPCMLAIMAVYASILIQHRKSRETWKSFTYVVSAGILGLAIICGFLATRLDDIQKILNTSYPGARVVESGGIGPTRIFSDIVQPFLQNTNHVQAYTDNQSESSNFALPLLSIIAVASYILIFAYTKRREIRFEILLLLILLGLFLMRMIIPVGDSLYKLILLGSVPNLRLLVGVGFVCFLLLLFCIRYLYNNKDKAFYKLAPIVTYVVGIGYAYILFAHSIRYPGFISNTLTLSLLLLYVTLFTWLLLSKKVLVATILLLTFSIFSSAWIHPLYKGTSILTNNALSKFVQQEAAQHPDKYWAVNNNVIMENIPVVNDAKSLSGTFVIPQNETFTKLIPDADLATTNRYAHVTYNFSNMSNDHLPSLSLNQADHFTVNINPCDSGLKALNLGYIISNDEIISPCTSEIFVYSMREDSLLKTFVYEVR